MQRNDSLLLRHALFLEAGTCFALEILGDNDHLCSDFVQWDEKRLLLPLFSECIDTESASVRAEEQVQITGH